MVSFDVCENNPGAMMFLQQAYALDMFGAERVFQRMQNNHITGDKLYMLWSDCCDRNTSKAMTVMDAMSIDEIVRHINYDEGRGLPITDEDISFLQEEKKFTRRSMDGKKRM